MDVNGARYHLLKGEFDWKGCLDGASGRTWTRLYLDKDAGTVTLNPVLSLFKHQRVKTSLPLAPRRGAARDRFGNVYWISQDERRIYWLPGHAKRPVLFWSQEPDECATPDDPFRRCAAPNDAFQPVADEQPGPRRLAGLAVTENLYLIAGDVTGRGVVIFDLISGGEPAFLRWPDGVAFTPFDLAAAPGGGVWILDREHRLYWGLDRQFRVVAAPPPLASPPPGATETFHPVGGEAVFRTAPRFPDGFPLAAQDPISVESLPDGSVLILDRVSDGDPAPPSALYHYRLGRRLSGPLPLQAFLDVITEGAGGGEVESRQLSIAGHDIAYAATQRPRLYVVESDGNQAIALHLDLEASPPRLEFSADYLPMHFFGGRALVGDGERVFYDVTGTGENRDDLTGWARLHEITQPRFIREGELLTPVFDGRERDTVWHRLFLDACIPAESETLVEARAHDDRDLLESAPFEPAPKLYLRSGGAEIPFHRPFADQKQSPENAGVWELLMQQPDRRQTRGQFMQLRLTLRGNGRVTPQIHALRVYYPRFSYPKRYLPAVYLEDEEAGMFLERFLANQEGFFTEIEGKLGEVSALFDARSAPPEALDWLASWLGLVMDPLWARLQEKRGQARNATNRPAEDRRRLFIRFARLLYETRGTVRGMRLALSLLLDPCLEQALDRLKDAAVKPDVTLNDRLARLNLPAPTPTSTEEELEDLLRDWLLAPERPSKVRIVERFLTRGGRGVVAGDPTQAGAPPSSQSDSIAANAHRFSVLVPEALTDDEEAMVGRVTGLEKPAHTQFDVRRYWDYFRAGEARLGIDTVLGAESRFVEMTLDRDALSSGYLPPGHPMNAPDRLIANRDHIGAFPPL